MRTFEQGYRLSNTDLTIDFVKKISFSYGPLANYDPNYVSYEIGKIEEDSAYTRIGPNNRVPELVKIGLYRANFIVGDNWIYGTYRIIWKYQLCSDDSISTSSEDFIISNSYNRGNSIGLSVTL